MITNIEIVWTFRDETLSTVEKPHYTYDLLAKSEDHLYTGLARLFYRDKRSADVLKLTPITIRVGAIPEQYRPNCKEYLALMDYGYFSRSNADKIKP